MTKEQIFLFGNQIFLYGEWCAAVLRCVRRASPGSSARAHALSCAARACSGDVDKMNAILGEDGLAAKWAEICDNSVRSWRPLSILDALR